MSSILIAPLVMGGVGILCGGALTAAAMYFAVKEDPRVEKALEILPGVNCGGCGYAGCADYAKAVVLEGAPPHLCAPGGSETTCALCELLGIEAEASERKVAIVLCAGDNSKAGRKSSYNGVSDCRAAAAVDDGDKTCRYGCLGYGTCAEVCPVDAIEMTDKRLAVVHPETCIGCGACVKACPRGIIKMVPASSKIHILCSSGDPGAVARKACAVACIGCRRCVKHVEGKGISMDGTLAVVDYDSPPGDESVTDVCPDNCIVVRVIDGEKAGRDKI